MSGSDDEFDTYDFSEFTARDLAAIDAELARAQGGPAIQVAIEDSPFSRFLSWKKHLAVTDLVSPLWCEVQYEYSLYGKRHRPLHLRPSAFTARSGKRIHVHQQVAHANDRRLKHGKSIHKALEDELYPDKLVVHAVSEEERFGLRLLQLIDGLNHLDSNGIARELPVFAITHAQIVLGVIDEVLRVPVNRANTDQAASSTPGSPPKKQRPSSSPTISPALQSSSPMNTGRTTDSTIPADCYELRIIDYKTRRSQNIPLDDDTLSPRLQLMMYHRMLSSLLQPETFDFDLLWSRLNLSPTKPFSSQFLKDIFWERRRIDPTDHDVHLNRLVSEWISTVQQRSTGFMGVSQQLQIVYRRSIDAARLGIGKHRTIETVDTDDPLEALALQEELDLARAIEESLCEMGHREAGHVVHHVVQDIEDVGPPSTVQKDLTSPQDSDPMLAWATQQSLLTYAHSPYAHVPANKSHLTDNPPFDEASPVAITPKVPEETAADRSPIIGTKMFRMDDDELDAHLADVLQWWFGTRPARGVGVGQTNRCFTCEFQGSCEWREGKAREAAARASHRKVQ